MKICMIVALLSLALPTTLIASDKTADLAVCKVEQQVQNELSKCESKLHEALLQRDKFRSTALNLVWENQKKMSTLSRELYTRIKALEKELLTKDNMFDFEKSEYEKVIRFSSMTIAKMKAELKAK